MSLSANLKYSRPSLHLSGVPFVVSMPHFYLSDLEYVNAVGGLSPRKEEHEVVFIVEPVSIVQFQLL